MLVSVTRALTELKTLDKRINKALDDAMFIGMQTGKKPQTGFKTVDDITKKISADYQSVTDLIARRAKIKSAIVKSNAQTIVKIAGEEFTVAEVIERKSSIEYERNLLQKAISQFNGIHRQVEIKNNDMQNRLDDLLKKNFEKDSKAKIDEIDAIAVPYKELNEAKVIDPIDLRNVIEKLSKKIDDFEMNCDFVLSESNTITQIEIPE